MWKFRQLRPDLVPFCKAPVAKAATVSTIQKKRFHKVWEDRVDKSLGLSSEGVWVGASQVGTNFKKAFRNKLLPSRGIDCDDWN